MSISAIHTQTESEGVAQKHHVKKILATLIKNLQNSLDIHLSSLDSGYCTHGYSRSTRGIVCGSMGRLSKLSSSTIFLGSIFAHIQKGSVTGIGKK